MDSPRGADPISHGTVITHMRALCAELWNLRAEGAFCDVILSVQGEPMSAHSVILGACSPILKKLCIDKSFSSPPGAVNISIEHYSYKVCLKTLEFMYTGEKVRFEEQPDLQEEFKRLAKDWELFESAFKTSEERNFGRTGAQGENVDSGYSGSTGDISKTVDKESNSKAAAIIGHGVSQKENIPSSQSEGLEHKSEIRHTRNIRRKRTVNKKRKNITSGEDSNDEEDSVEETREKTDQSLDKSPQRSLRSRITKRLKVKAYQEVSEDDFDEEPLCSDSVNGEKDETENEDDKSEPKTISKASKDKGKKHRRKLKIAKTVPKKGERRGRRNQCYRCNLKFNTREEYLAHGKEVHPRSLLRKQGLTCKVCNAQFYHHNLLQIHKLENHWEEGMKPAKMYKCDFENCTYNTSRYAAFNQHRKGHTAETCVCDICGKLMKNRFSLKSHVEIIHERKQEKYCEKCDKTFSTRQAFKNHNINLHLGKRVRLFCSRCGYSCNRQETLNEHMLSTHDEQVSSNVFSCCICDFKTTEKRKLERHERTHNLGERLQCEVCGKSYTSRTSLSHHKRIHNNTAKIYKCTYCEYKTVYGVGSLRQHVRCMHKDKEMKPWKCDDCTYAAMTEDILIHHKTTIHGIPLPDKPPDSASSSSSHQQDLQSMNSYKRGRSKPQPGPSPSPPQQQHSFVHHIIPQQQEQQHQQQQGIIINHQEHQGKDLPPPNELLSNAPHVNNLPTTDIRTLPDQSQLQQSPAPASVPPHEDPSSRQDNHKPLPPMPMLPSRSATGYVEVPLNFSLFRTPPGTTQTFPPPYDPSTSSPQAVTSAQVLMGTQTQLPPPPPPPPPPQNPMIPGSLNNVHGWGDFQNF